MSKVLIAVVLLGLVQAPARYAFDAGGRPARIDQTWELRSSGDAISVFFSLARCGRSIFISDNQNNVFRVDAGQPSSALARFAGDEQGLGRPTALAADCARQRLYVLNAGPRSIAAFDLGSGKVVGTHPYQRELFAAYSLVIAAPGILHTGGLWTPDYQQRPLVARPVGAFFERASIGERLALDTGAVSAGPAAYESRCTGANACTSADVDAVGDGASAGWIASQAISTRVARYTAAGARLSTFDVRSPKFVRDGSELPIKSEIADVEKWRSRNSVIRRVFAVGGQLVVAHSRTIIGPSWVAGEQPQLEVFMNIYDGNGKPLVADVRLPDLPIGKDATHLYAIDYGPAGRGNEAARVRLVRIPVMAGAAVVQ